MSLRKTRVVHWPRYVVASCVGYLARWLVMHGYGEQGMRVAGVADRLWNGIEL